MAANDDSDLAQASEPFPHRTASLESTNWIVDDKTLVRVKELLIRSRRGCTQSSRNCNGWKWTGLRKVCVGYSSTCTACAAGQELSGNSCKNCGANQYSTGGGKNACKTQGICNAGYFISADSKTSRRSCTTCPVGKNQPANNHQLTSCIWITTATTTTITVTTTSTTTRTYTATTTTTTTITTTTTSTATSTTTTLNAEQLGELNITAADLRTQNVTARELIWKGFPPKVLVLAGYTEQDLIDAGVDPELVDVLINGEKSNYLGAIIATILVFFAVTVFVAVKKQKAALPLEIPDFMFGIGANTNRAVGVVHNPTFTLNGGLGAADAHYETVYSNGSWDNQQFYVRVVGARIKLDDNPLAILDHAPAISLKRAIEEAAVHCSTLWQPNTIIFSFEEPLDKALDFGNTLLANEATTRQQGHPTLPEGFTAENAATIHIYTQDTPLYAGLNGALGGWGKGNPEGAAAIPHYLSYANLFQSACSMLPKFAGRLFRGIPESVNAVLGGKVIGDVIQFNAVTSTSKTPAVVQDKQFLDGENGTILQIAAFSGVQIAQFSAYVTEDEVLILPGTRFKIDRIKRSTNFNNVFEVAMHQVPPEYAALIDNPTVYSIPDPLSLYSSICPLYEEIDVYLAPGGSVTLPPFTYDDSHGEYGMIVSIDLPLYDLASESSHPFYDLAANAKTELYDNKVSLPANVDVLAATTNSAGVSAVYSIPLDVGNDFAKYDKVRAEALQSSITGGNTLTHLPNKGPRKRSSTISETLSAASARSARLESSAHGDRNRTSTLGWGATLPTEGITVRPIEGRYQNQGIVAAAAAARARTSTLGWDAAIPAVRPVEGRYQNQGIVAAASWERLGTVGHVTSSSTPANADRRTATLGWDRMDAQSSNTGRKIKGRSTAGSSKVATVVQQVGDQYQNQATIDSTVNAKSSSLPLRIVRNDPFRNSGACGFESKTSSKHKTSMYNGFEDNDDSDIDI